LLPQHTLETLKMTLRVTGSARNSLEMENAVKVRIDLPHFRSVQREAPNNL